MHINHLKFSSVSAFELAHSSAWHPLRFLLLFAEDILHSETPLLRYSQNCGGGGGGGGGLRRDPSPNTRFSTDFV